MANNPDLQYRLYLSQGEENIYLDDCKIPIHHIEGIRFLFREFKRKTPGVILNDPYECSRYIQIVLFLKAIRSLLLKPVLILCSKENVKEWLDQFFTWAEYHSDVIALGNPYPRKEKLIVINAMTYLPVYCSREWSIIIVDQDNNESVNQLLNFPFKAHFKIWSTKIDMKNNLYKFGEIYKWMYPNEAFNVAQYLPNFENPVDVWKKSLQLDSFMGDIVLRREDISDSYKKYQRDFLTPAEKPAPDNERNGSNENRDVTANAAVNGAETESNNQPTTEKRVTEEETRPTIEEQAVANVNVTANVAGEGSKPAPVSDIRKSIKNKDITGTKIKRTKPKPADATATEQDSKPPSVTILTGEGSKRTEVVITRESLAAVLVNLLGGASKPLDIAEDFSIENFQKKNKGNGEPSNKGKESQSNIIEIEDSDSQEDGEVSNGGYLAKTSGVEQTDTQVQSIKQEKTDEEPNKAVHETFKNKDEILILSDEIKKEKEMDTIQTITEVISKEHKRSDKCSLPPENIEAELTRDNGTEKNTDELVNDLGAKEHNSDAVANEMKIQKLKIRIDKGSDEIIKTSDAGIAKLKLSKHSKKHKKRSKRDKSESTVKDKPAELNEENEEQSAEDTNAKSVKFSLKRSTQIDEKVKQYEEKLKKKFKGSFLDNLF